MTPATIASAVIGERHEPNGLVSGRPDACPPTPTRLPDALAFLRPPLRERAQQEPSPACGGGQGGVLHSLLCESRARRLPSVKSGSSWTSSVITSGGGSPTASRPTLQGSPIWPSRVSRIFPPHLGES